MSTDDKEIQGTDEEEEQEKKRNMKMGCAVLAGLLVFILLGFGLCVALSGDTETEPQMRKTAAPTVAARPTVERGVLIQMQLDEFQRELNKSLPDYWQACFNADMAMTFFLESDKATQDRYRGRMQEASEWASSCANYGLLD